MSRNSVYLSLIALLLCSMSSNAQFQKDVYRQYNEVSVKSGANFLQLPWTGGANRPQMAMADLNQDGKEDIVMFEDYIGVKTLLSTAPGSYKYNSLYEGNFPPNMSGYFKLIDVNGDDIKDLIHRNTAGVGIFYGYYSNSMLKFKYYKDLYYTNPTGAINLYVSPSSMPGIVDIDNDGDLDFFSYDVGGSAISFYKNLQKEKNLHKDSIEICFKSACWGGVYQYYEREMLLGTWCEPNGKCKGCGKTGNKGTHGLNSITFIDIDNDGDLDFFNGNESYSDIQFLFNGKTQFGVDSIVDQDTLWGANGVDMKMPIFPAAYVLNVNHDEADDLIFTPMSDNAENYKSIVYYQNVGTNANKNFVFKSNTYLIDRMIDLGKGSYPVLYDFDKDGKKDLLVGSDGYYQASTGKNKSRVSYYLNTTNAEKNYQFSLQTDDFLSLDTMNLEGAALAIGDIDNDSLDDLVIGRSDGTFAFFKNYAASNNVPPVWKLEQSVLTDASSLQVLDVGDFATPCIYDIDNDGKMDLVSGNQLGDLYYYNNYGTSPGYIGLKKETENLGGVKINDLYHTYAYSAPYIGTMDDTKIDYLVVGCAWGRLYRYDGFQNGAMPAQYSMIDSQYSFIDVGNRSTPAFANIDNDPNNLHEMILGNELGGLNFYKQDFKASVSDKVAGNRDVHVYPNPAKDMLNVKWGDKFNNEGVTVRLVSVTGQSIAEMMVNEGELGCSIVIGDVPSGIYYCIIQSGDAKSIQPVTILK